MKHVLLILLLSAACFTCVSALQKKDVSELLEQEGRPSFTAKAVEARGNLLVCADLELFEGGKEKADERFRGVVLLFCEPWDFLWLATAHSYQRMKRATPFLGHERPGTTFMEEFRGKGWKNETMELPAPARVFVAYVDDRGRVVRTVEMIVEALRFKD